MFFCSHKFSKLEGDVQYCEKCGIANIIEHTPCQHQWKNIEKIETRNV